ncbi:hypothetical protein FKM82_006544 [Ascaphus truei]
MYDTYCFSLLPLNLCGLFRHSLHYLHQSVCAGAYFGFLSSGTLFVGKVSVCWCHDTGSNFHTPPEKVNNVLSFPPASVKTIAL